MHAALFLCTALLTADSETLTVRVVNTLEEPVQLSYRISGKKDFWAYKPELEAAQTKDYSLEKSDGYEFGIQNEKKQQRFFGPFDLHKMLAKDAKAEIHIVESKKPTAKRGKLVPVTQEYTYTILVTRADGTRVPETRTGTRQVFEELPEADDVAKSTGLADPSRMELSVFSNKTYFPIDEFINGKQAEKPHGEKSRSTPDLKYYVPYDAEAPSDRPVPIPTPQPAAPR